MDTEAAQSPAEQIPRSAPCSPQTPHQTTGHRAKVRKRLCGQSACAVALSWPVACMQVAAAKSPGVGFAAAPQNPSQVAATPVIFPTSSSSPDPVAADAMLNATFNMGAAQKVETRRLRKPRHRSKGSRSAAPVLCSNPGGDAGFTVPLQQPPAVVAEPEPASIPLPPASKLAEVQFMHCLLRSIWMIVLQFDSRL